MTFGKLRADNAKLLSSDETRKRILDALLNGERFEEEEEEEEEEDKTSGKEESDVASCRVEIWSSTGGVGMTESCT